MGKELKDDEHYQKRLSDPDYLEMLESQQEQNASETTAGNRNAKISVGIFLIAAVLVVIMGSVESLRPFFPDASGKLKPLDITHTIEIVMLTAGALILLICRPDGTAITRGSVFHAGMRAVIAIFGIAWLGDTLMHAHMGEVKELVSGLVKSAPWTFAFALFILSVLVNSQGATVRSEEHTSELQSQY